MMLRGPVAEHNVMGCLDVVATLTQAYWSEQDIERDSRAHRRHVLDVMPC